MITTFEPQHTGLLLSLQMIADELEELGWDYAMVPDDLPRFRGYRLYPEGGALRGDVLYLLHGEQLAEFPQERFPCLVLDEPGGEAPHISVRGRTMLEVCSVMNRIFQRYHDFEAELSSIVGSGDLNDLCRAGGDFFENPMYIHDNLFTILARPCSAVGMLEPEYNPETGKQYIPLWLIEDFKFNRGYTETLHQQQAQIWGNDQYPYHIRSLYVNIWDGGYYRARLLINELHTLLKPGQFRLAEYLAGCIRLILRRDEQDTNRHYRNLEDTIKNMIAGQEADRSDLHVLLTALAWQEDDPYLCVKLQSQGANIAVSSGNAFRGALSTALRGTFSFFLDQQLCLVVNLNTAGLDVAAVRSRLAPLLRDSYMYGGFSSPIPGFRQLAAGFLQAELALNETLRRRDSQWFTAFRDCAFPYILRSIRTPLPPELLADPALLRLRAHDAEKKTQYYATLRCFLEHERSIPRTAQALFIHRTTLLYRLEKLGELAPLDLEDETVRLYLLLSFQLLDREPQK